MNVCIFSVKDQLKDVEKTWIKHYIIKTSEDGFEGFTASTSETDKLIQSYELATTSSFIVARTEKKNLWKFW